MGHFFTYLAPPLLGALIGYVTNYVAIRMLFRPLRPWRLFGLRLPMTPGVIPAKRHDLARNIGSMVGRHLLTGSDISKALNGLAFKRQLGGMINGKVDNLLNRDLGPLSTAIPERFRSYFEAGMKILRWRSLKVLHNHLDSEVFAGHMAPIIAKHLDAFMQKPLNSVLAADGRRRLFTFLETTLNNTLASPGTEQWLQEYLGSKIETMIKEGRSINDLLPAPFTPLIVQLIEQEVPGLLAKAAQLTGEKESQDRIAKAICAAINNFIAGLGPMAALAAGFISPELIESKVKEYLENHGDELADWLLNEDVQNKAKSLLTSKVNDFLNRPLSEILAGVEEQKLIEIRQGISRQAARALQDPKISKAITDVLQEALEDQAENQLQTIIGTIFGADGLQYGRQRTSEEVVSLMRSTKVKNILDQLISNLIDRQLLSRPIGALANLLPKAVQNGFGEYLIQQTNTLLAQEVPGLIDSLNIEQIVIRKVDSLDLLHLEGLLLSIMQEQFKYINLFGGLLGFIIGLLNLVFLM